MTPHRPKPRGVTLVIVVAALMLLAIVSAALVRLVALQSDRASRDADRAQAAWLIEAGLERAWTRLGREPDYPGETWELSAEDLAGRPASVRIAVQPVDGALAIEVAVEYPAGSAATVRTTKTFQARPPTGRSGDPSP